MKESMKAVILAAGEGTRLRPFTASEPKVMIPVANRPILEWVVEALVSNNIRDIIIVVGYKKERIMSHFEDGKKFGARITFVEEKRQLGTAHALSCAKPHIKSRFMLLPGDNIIGADVIEELLNGGEGNSMLVTPSDTPSKYGVVYLSGDAVREVIEKPEGKISNLISTGIYTFEPDIFKDAEQTESSGKYDLASMLQSIIYKKKVKAVLTSGTWADAVYPWDIVGVNAKALLRAKMGTAGTVEKNVVIKGQVSIGEGSAIRSGSYIVGPVVIGSSCEIGPNAFIKSSTSIGDNVELGPFTTVEQCVLMSDVKLGAVSYLSHSVLGEGVRTGSHFMASAGAAKIVREKEVFDLPNIGALVGEDTEIGNGVAVHPGTIIGSGCRIGAMLRVYGEIQDNAVLV
jgi:glucose-1-phosphate thymidylyltransferase